MAQKEQQQDDQQDREQEGQQQEEQEENEDEPDQVRLRQDGIITDSSNSSNKNSNINCNNISICINSKIFLQSIFGQRVLCTLSDGRTASGRLICIDRLKNLILSDCICQQQICSTDYKLAKDDVINDISQQPEERSPDTPSSTQDAPPPFVAEAATTATTAPTTETSTTTPTATTTAAAAVHNVYRQIATRHLQQAMIPGNHLVSVHLYIDDSDGDDDDSNNGDYNINDCDHDGKDSIDGSYPPSNFEIYQTALRKATYHHSSR